MSPLAPVVAALLAAAPGTTVTPFRTEVAPRVDPVFGDVASLRQAVDRFLALHAEMEQVRGDFSTSVHGTLAQLAAAPPKGKGCPSGAVAQYQRALVAGGKYLGLGRQLEARFREIRRSDELGDAAGLTPDYRVKMKHARELYLELLRDYREMRVAFYDQLGAEMHHAGCALPAPAAAAKSDGVAGAPDPSDPSAWELEDPSAEAPAAEAKPTSRPARPTPSAIAAAPAVWITIDNSHCAERSQLTVDGAQLGVIAGRKKTTVRTRSGPHELCILPASDKRACGDPGTIRRAYLSEGWTMVVRCGSQK
jgi:hypothetical protein